MLVEDWMSRKPVCVKRSTPVGEAQRALTKHHFRQLLVTDRGRLIGVVTDRDLRAAGTDAKRVGDVMSFDPETIAASDSVDSAAHMLRSWKVNALPVMRDRKLVGVISTSDVLDAFVALSGVAEPSYRVIIVPRKGAALDAVRAVIEGTRSEVRWVRERGKGRGREAQARVVTNDIESVVLALEAEGHSVSCTITSPGATDVAAKRR